MKARKGIRYRLGAPAVFHWEGVHRRCFQGEGMTRDISVQGAFILAATSPPADCAIQVDFLLPSIEGMNSLIRISGKGRVVRIDHASGQTGADGFAVVTDGLHQWSLTTVQGESEPELVPEMTTGLKSDRN